MILQFVRTNILAKKLRNFLTVFSIMISVMLIISVGNITTQLKSNVIANAGHYDILVGAKGSSTQLILNSLFFYDVPIGNIDIQYLESLEKDNRVRKVVPMAMGDNYNGYKIVGTTTDYFHENFQLKKGAMLEKKGEVVIGSTVAKATGLKIGDTFSGMHGLTTEKGTDSGLLDHKHEDFKYTVVGILESTKTPNDMIIFTQIESVWGVHGMEHEEGELGHESENLVTALLIQSNNLSDQTLLVKELDAKEDIQAINPAATLRKLLTTLNVGEVVVTIVAYVSIFLSVITLFTTMLSASIERRKDISILRALGANRKTVFMTILLETLIIALIGTVLGFFFAHLGIGILGNYAVTEFGIDISGWFISQSEFFVLIGAVILSMIAGVIPGIMVYKTDATRYLK